MFSINTNLSSLVAQNSLNKSTNALNLAIERMTTGFKINHSKDNAANYSISTNMQTKIQSYNIAADNVAMGMDLVTTASDTISLMQDYATRLQALSTQARNGTYGAGSINAINVEAEAIMKEIDRLYSTAQYNDIALFTGCEGVAAASEEPEVATFAMPRATDTTSMVTMTQLASGTTSATNEYSISSKDELVALANYVNSGNDTSGMTFVLGANIDLSSVTNWTPIGDYSTDTNNIFKGTFDGNGHVIKNVKINKETDYQGLFGYTSENAVIKNVGLAGGSFKGENFVGGLVGCSFSSISNCYVTGDVSGAAYVGGLVGGAGSSSSIANSYATGDVSGSDYVGGLLGYATVPSSITNSYATGDVSGSDCVGGLVGYAGSAYSGKSSPITNSYATGTATGNSNVGGLVGIDNADSVTNCAAVQTDSKATLMTEEQIKSTYTPESMGFTEANGWIIVNGQPVYAKQHVASSTGVESFTLQVGINGDASCQIGFNTNFEYDLSAVRANIASDAALNAIMDFSSLLNAQATQLASVQNRLESALDSIEVNINNLTSSLSTIRDADIAEVSSEYIRQQILQQASATLMATANQAPSIALQLI